MRTPVVFISSTSDLAAERQALAESLAPLYAPYLYERDRAGRHHPADRCRQMIEESDVFVCLLGEQFGSVYTFDVGSRSIVEWEFETARAQRHVELMAFRKDPLARPDPRQQAFIDRVTGFGSGVWTNSFRSPAELVQVVGRSLVQWLVEFRAQVTDARRRAGASVRAALLAISMAAVAGLLLLAVGPWRDAVSASSLIAATVAVACVVALACVSELRARS
jgi:hypothetical protein